MAALWMASVGARPGLGFQGLKELNRGGGRSRAGALRRLERDDVCGAQRRREPRPGISAYGWCDICCPSGGSRGRGARRAPLAIQLSAFNGYKWLPLALKKLNRYKYYQYLKGALGLIILG